MRMHRLPHIATGVILNPLSLSTPTVIEHTSAGVVVGTLSNMTGGSTLSITNTAGSRFALSGNNIVTGATATDYATATSQTITIRETLAGAVNTPLDTNIVISVTAGSFATPVITMTSTTGTNPPTWSSVMTDLQVGDSIQLDFTSNGSAPDGTAEETHSPVTSDEAINGAITWTTFTGFAGSSTVKWRVRYGRSGAWSAWSNTLSDTMSAPAFAPSSLYGVGDIGYVWNPTDLTTLKQNIDGTGAVAFTNTVGYMADQSGLGNNLLATGNDNTRPTVVNTNNGLLTFDGSNNKLLSIGGFYAKGAMTWIAAINATDSSANFVWAEVNFGAGNTNPVYAPGLRGAANTTTMLNWLRNDAGTTTNHSMVAALMTGTTHIYVVVDTGTTVKVSIDGGAFVSDSYTRSGALTGNKSSLGMAWIGNTSIFAPLTGSVGAGIIISRVLTGTTPASAGTELNSAYNWVATKHGLPTL